MSSQASHEKTWRNLKRKLLNERNHSLKDTRSMSSTTRHFGKDKSRDTGCQRSEGRKNEQDEHRLPGQ